MRSNTLPAIRQPLSTYESADQRRTAPLDAARRKTISRGIRFGCAAVAYTHCKKLERPALTRNLDISA